jgi:tRNA threonylcarbamoyl adenosine modification protein YeaZ
MKRGHAEALMPLIARVMDQAGVDFAELDRIAVTVGPGSFTGLRVGLSAARKPLFGHPGRKCGPDAAHIGRTSTTSGT